MIIALTLLDKQDVIDYRNGIPVSTNDGIYTIVGNCRVFRDQSGRHYGELYLDSDVNTDFYFYYRSMANNAGIFIFCELQFLKVELPNIPTVRLKEMIIG